MIIARRPAGAASAGAPSAPPLRRSSFDTVLGAVVFGIGLVAWAVVLRADLVLSHYDAKAHLVVARRVIDNITPGWQQVGAVWLPLPHLINLLPVQVDLFYRTGAFGSLVSMACFAIAAAAAARLVMLVTGSRAGAVTAAALLALNPNLLYLQATPMTEPLLLAVTMLTVLWLYEWLRSETPGVPRRVGWILFAAAWTRYEAWLVIAAALLAAAFALWRRGLRGRELLATLVHLGAWPAAAVMLFVLNSRITVGAWFVSDGFFEPDPTYQGRAVKSLISIWWGTHRQSGYVVEIVGLIAAVALAIRAAIRRTDAPLLTIVSVFAAGALPFYAFYEGHPFRIRYMIPTVAACALFGGLAVGRLPQRLRLAAGAALVASLLAESPFWQPQRAPMIEEAQWDVPASHARQQVTRCLADYRGEKVLASMGSLAHYMQELSRQGFAIADFVHEGTGDIWNLALRAGPSPLAGWMLVEERAEGGDVLARRIAADPGFARGMTRVCEGGGVALYRRAPGGAGEATGDTSPAVESGSSD